MKKVIIFDFDGTVVHSSLLEKICRKIFKKLGLLNPPRFFLAISELIDFIFFILGIKKIKVKEHIIKLLKQKEISVGMLTDRSKCSLCVYLNIIGVDKEKLIFVQARKSIFDFFSPCECNILLSPKIKPDLSAYEKLILFTEKSGFNRKEIVVVDDLLSARETAFKVGFLALDPDDPSLLKLTKPELNLV